jgi:hypothetical protein
MSIRTINTTSESLVGHSVDEPSITFIPRAG